MLIWLGRIFSVSGGGNSRDYYTREEIDAIFASSYTVRQLNDKLTQLDNTKADKTELPPIEDKIGDIETALDAILAGDGGEPAKLQTKEVTINENGNQTVSPDSGYNGLRKVDITVDVPEKTIDDFKLYKGYRDINQNGNQTFFVPDGYDAISELTIRTNVPSKEPVLQDKDVVIDSEDVVDVTPDSGFDGLKKVQVIPSTKEYYQIITQNGTHNINTGKDLYNGGTIDVNVQPELDAAYSLIGNNGTYSFTPDEKYYGLAKVTVEVNVQPSSQEKSVNVTRNGVTTVVPDDGIDGLSKVTINTEVEPNLEDKNLTVSTTEGGSVTFNAPYEGINKVDYTVETKQENKKYTENGTYNINEGNSLYNGGQIEVDVRGKIVYNRTSAPFEYGGGTSSVPYQWEEWNCDLVINNISSTLKSANNFMSYVTDLKSFIGDFVNINTTYRAFRGCTSLKTFIGSLKYVGTYSTQNQAQEMFGSCSALTTFKSDLSGLNSETYGWPSSSSPARFMFQGCSSLTNVELTGTLNCELSFSDCPLLTVDSMVNIMNALVNISRSNYNTITFGATNLAKLSDEQKAIATNKGWVLN